MHDILISNVLISNVFISLMALCLGAVMGAIFFGGLWWTVRKSLASTHPAVVLLTSLLLRITLVLAGLYSVIAQTFFKGHWQNLLLYLAGFVIARVLVIHMTKPSKPVYLALDVPVKPLEPSNAS